MPARRLCVLYIQLGGTSALFRFFIWCQPLRAFVGPHCDYVCYVIKGSASYKHVIHVILISLGVYYYVVVLCVYRTIVCFPKVFICGVVKGEQTF